jgi:hypothetical protein
MLVTEHPAKVRLARQNANDCGQCNAMRTQGELILGVAAVAANLVTAAPAHGRDYFIDGRARPSIESRRPRRLMLRLMLMEGTTGVGMSSTCRSVIATRRRTKATLRNSRVRRNKRPDPSLVFRHLSRTNGSAGQPDDKDTA